MKHLYTVLLLYPDTVAQQYGEETYLTWVQEDDIKTAIQSAQIEASTDFDLSPLDFLPLFACYGHHQDLVACGDEL